MTCPWSLLALAGSVSFGVLVLGVWVWRAAYLARELNAAEAQKRAALATRDGLPIEEGSS